MAKRTMLDHFCTRVKAAKLIQSEKCKKETRSDINEIELRKYIYKCLKMYIFQHYVYEWVVYLIATLLMDN